MSNKYLKKAKAAKNDEFYTPLEIIEKELCYYKDLLKNKIIYCNCDDYQKSIFVKYFKDNFHNLKLKQVIAVGYNVPDYYIYNGEQEILKPLKGNGDFRNPECIEILKTADIVITNPPFSLFREYLQQLIDYQKKFLIIGNLNAPSSGSIFPLFKNKKVQYGINSKNMYFYMPDAAKEWHFKRRGKKVASVTACWFTNLDVKKRLRKLSLFKSYKRHQYLYPKYANIQWEGEPIIFVQNVTDIPRDYYGVMGVPHSIFNNFDLKNFEILSLSKGKDNKIFENDKMGKLRILKQGVKKELTNKCKWTGIIEYDETLSQKMAIIEYDEKRDKKDILYLDEKTGKKYFVPFARILVRRKKCK